MSKKASICQAAFLPKIDAKFLRWGKGRGAHVGGVGMLFVSFLGLSIVIFASS